MRLRGWALALAALSLAACAPTAPKGVDKAALDDAVSRAIGGPTTCLLIGERASGKVLYRYNTATVCARSLASCAGSGTQTVQDLLRATAADGKPRRVSCNSGPDASRGVAWAAAVLPASGDVYAAVMEGEQTFPGMMIAERLEPRLAALGL